MYPEVENYGDINQESFQSYYVKWTDNLSSIPKCIVEQWIHRHWNNFQEWRILNPHKWKYELKELSNYEILKIEHQGKWINDLHMEGKTYFNNGRRRNSPISKFMLENGTTPKPIMIAINRGSVIYPKVKNTYMKEPYQLIEGHTRLGCLFGMIDANDKELKSKHKVWLIRIPHESIKNV